jgi:hypothetical protein
MAKKVFVTFADLQAEVTQQFSGLKSGVVYQFARGEISWSEIQATSVDLNYYSINQYFGPDLLSFTDSAVVEFIKLDSETLALTDAQEIALQKQVADALSFNDNVNIALVFNRNFSDSAAVSDVSVLTVDKAAADSISLSENFIYVVSKGPQAVFNGSILNTFVLNS